MRPERVVELVREHAPGVEVLTSRALHPGDRPAWWFRWPGSRDEMQMDGNLVLRAVWVEGAGEEREIFAESEEEAARVVMGFLEESALGDED